MERNMRPLSKDISLLFKNTESEKGVGKLRKVADKKRYIEIARETHRQTDRQNCTQTETQIY